MGKELKEDRKKLLSKMFKSENIGCFSLMFSFVIFPAITIFKWWTLAILLWIICSYITGFIQGWDNNKE